MDIPRDEVGNPDLYAKTSKDSDFNANDRSEENEKLAVDELKKEFGPGYKSAVKNAKKVLAWADENYPKSLEKTGLGNYPPLVKALNKLGFEFEKKYKKANKPGTTRKASLKAFQKTAREKVNHLITKIEAEYIKSRKR